MHEFKLITTAFLLTSTANASAGYEQYGLAGLFIASLWGFTVWSERRRDKREQENREAQQKQFEAVVEALHRRDESYEKLVHKLTEKQK